MMESMIEGALGVAKESIKTISLEALNNTIKLVNGFSAMLLALLPGKTTVLEGIHGWELHPTFRGPRMPKWMEDGVSSFNQFIHEYSIESDSEMESEYESGFDDDSMPGSPVSQVSLFSSSSRLERRHKNSILRYFLRGMLWPLRYFFSVGHPSPQQRRKGPSRSGSSGSLTSLYSLASKRFNSMKDYVMHQRLDSRRRGVIEDLQLLMELSIEKVFDAMFQILHYLTSPLETLRMVLQKVFLQEEAIDGDFAPAEQSEVLGDMDPNPMWRKKPESRLNTDARTCEDVITELGYPYEALRVTTEDGYILLLERIPRCNSQKVLYLQHGVLDSSLGWVSNGAVGSQAFAAYDQGYDVFLGNFRGLASREHTNKSISSERYWRYSINEHGTQDIPAMIDKIHEIKMTEFKHQDSNADSAYTMVGVGHSLGGAAMLMYVVTRRLEDRPHHLSRLILLSPAGFHSEAPALCYILQYLIPLLAPILRPLFPGIYLPSKFLRMVLNKLARDFQHYPALGGLVQLLFGYAIGGDSSNWVGAIGQSHYNMDDMPGVAYRVAEHLSQIMRSKRFIMFDFGSVSANLEAYLSPEPLDIGAHYGVIDIPVDFVGGKKDKLIPKSMVRKHYETMKAAGCETSYEEFEYAHLDFTFSHREELLAYVLSRLRLHSHRYKRQSSTRQRNRSTSLRKRESRKNKDSPEEKSFGNGNVYDSQGPVEKDSNSNHEVLKEEEDDPNEMVMNGSSLFAFPSKNVASAFMGAISKPKPNVHSD